MADVIYISTFLFPAFQLKENLKAVALFLLTIQISLFAGNGKMITD
jgi:hypothetical protein